MHTLKRRKIALCVKHYYKVQTLLRFTARKCVRKTETPLISVLALNNYIFGCMEEGRRTIEFLRAYNIEYKKRHVLLSVLTPFNNMSVKSELMNKMTKTYCFS